MIVEALVGLVTGLLRAVLTLIPDWTLPDFEDGSAMSGMASWVGWANGYFPLRHLFLAIGILLGFQVVTAAWSVAVFLYDRLPFKAT